MTTHNGPIDPLIVRGIPLDSQTQVGFAGTVTQSLLQQGYKVVVLPEANLSSFWQRRLGSSDDCNPGLCRKCFSIQCQCLVKESDEDARTQEGSLEDGGK